jgi:hypothetical protein
LELKLNVGSGERHIEGYVSVDRKGGGEAFPLKYYGKDVAPETVDVIRASHVLEHFPYPQTPDVVKHWVDCLKPGGVLKVAVPDFAYLAKAYAEGKDTPHPIEAYLMGGHTDGDDRHGAIFDEAKLRALLEGAGLTNVEPWESEITDCATLPVSLNLQGTKPYPKLPESPARETLTQDEFCRQNPFLHYAANTYSQNGEDGILAEIFRRVGTTNKWCFECGAGDGLRFSNVRKLIDAGWSGVLVERDTDQYAKLESLLVDHRVWTFNRTLGDTHTVDSLLAEAGAPKDIDLAVIDIDGQDYYAFLGMVKYKPRVVMVEFDQTADKNYIPERNGKGQAGQRAVVEAGWAKEYVAVCATLCNVIFVRRELVGKLCEEPFDEAAEAPAQMSIAGVMSMPRLGFSDTFHCVTESFLRLRIPMHQQQGVFWGHCLNEGIASVVEAHKPKYVLTLDYDTGFKPDDVKELYRLMEENPDVDAVFPLQYGRELVKRPLFVPNGPAPKGGVAHVEAEKFDTDLMPVRTGHFGLTLLRVSSLAKLPKPWFWEKPDPKGGWGEGRLDPDIWFWHQAGQAGWKVCLAPRVVVAHFQMVATWPGQSFEAVHQFVSVYRSDGKPKEAWTGRAD